MEIPNAFIGHTAKPTPTELAEALGLSTIAWDELLGWLAQHGVTAQDWKSYSSKTGWSLLPRMKGRTILYLSPCKNCFEVSVILGDKAVQSARELGIPGHLRKLIAKGPRYPEGTAVRLTVKQTRDLVDVYKLTEIKLGTTAPPAQEKGSAVAHRHAAAPLPSL